MSHAPAAIIVAPVAVTIPPLRAVDPARAAVTLGVTHVYPSN